VAKTIRQGGARWFRRCITRWAFSLAGERLRFHGPAEEVGHVPVNASSFGRRSCSVPNIRSERPARLRRIRRSVQEEQAHAGRSGARSAWDRAYCGRPA
jgi:hypothetical protein